MNRTGVGIAMLALALLSACGGGSAPPSASVAASTQTQPTLTVTLVEDTATPTAVPLIALVNGEPISLASYQAELARLQAASGAPDWHSDLAFRLALRLARNWQRKTSRESWTS